MNTDNVSKKTSLKKSVFKMAAAEVEQLLPNLNQGQRQLLARLQNRLMNQLTNLPAESQQDMLDRFQQIANNPTPEGLEDLMNELENTSNANKEERRKQRKELRRIQEQQAADNYNPCKCDFFPNMEFYRGVKCSFCREPNPKDEDFIPKGYYFRGKTLADFKRK